MTARGCWLLAGFLVGAALGAGGCSSDPPSAPRTQPDLPGQTQARHLLWTADCFAGSAVGFGGITPQVVVAFRVVLKSETATQTFRELLREGTLPGQLYALAGLYLTDPDGFWQEIPPYRTDGRMVETFFGCIRQPEPVSTVAEGIVAGDLPRSLAGD